MEIRIFDAGRFQTLNQWICKWISLKTNLILNYQLISNTFQFPRQNESYLYRKHVKKILNFKCEYQKIIKTNKEWIKKIGSLWWKKTLVIKNSKKLLSTLVARCLKNASYIHNMPTRKRQRKESKIWKIDNASHGNVSVKSKWCVFSSWNIDLGNKGLR